MAATGGTGAEQGAAHAAAAPAISVVMPARNEAPYVAEAIASVLAQSLADFELVVCDDGSQDGTAEIVAEMAVGDPRIRVVRPAASLGVWNACNHAIGVARAPLIARMDADDIAHPEWLERLHATIAPRPDVVLVGCLWEGIDAGGRLVRAADRWRLTRPSVFPPFGHGSSLFRKAAFDRIGGYRQAAIYWEDFDLTLRLAREGAMLVVPDVLYRYRFAATSTRLVSDQQLVERAIDTMFRCADAYRATGDYEAILAAADAPDAATSRQRTLLSLSSNRIWNGTRPRRWRRWLAPRAGRRRARR